MKERILLVGEDPLLLATRALLLSDWETETVHTFKAINRIESESFDLVVIGHTVPEVSARVLIWGAKELENPPEPAIRTSGGDDDLGVETHASDLYESPAWLRERVSEMLTHRRTPCPQASSNRNPLHRHLRTGSTFHSWTAFVAQ